jgi:hypothetical protein
MPDSFMPAYSQSAQPNPASLQESAHIVSDRTPNLVQAPNVTTIADNNPHDLNGGLALHADTRYEIQIVPDDPAKFVRGWLCLGSPATIYGGPVLDSNHPHYPVLFRSGDAAPFLSFIRDAATAEACKVYINLREPAI